MLRKNSRPYLKKVRNNLFFILVAITTLSFIGLIMPFITTAFWAAVLAIIFYNLNVRIRLAIGNRPNTASFLTTILILFFVIIPMVLLAIALFQQATQVFAALQSGELDPLIIVNYIEEQIPQVSDRLESFGISTDNIRTRITSLIMGVTEIIANQAIKIGSNVVNVFIRFTLMLYILYFLLRDGKMIVNNLINTIPMGNTRERTLFTRFAEVAQATLKGTLIVALVQGSIGGLLFWSLGIPASLLWGVAMTLLALLPVGGSGIIWLPAAIILFIQGNITDAIIIVIVGSLIIGLVDNLLRPLLVGRDTNMPDYLVLISTLGGITYFGLSGFVIGPTIAALFITVWEMMGKEYGGKV